MTDPRPKSASKMLHPEREPNAASPLSEERVREIRYRYEMELKHHGVDLLYVGALLGHIDAITADRTALTARLEAVERENAELREAKR